MQRRAIILTALGILSGFTLLFQNCSPVGFSQNPSAAGASAAPNNLTNCGGSLQTSNANLRIMFMVDNSGSTLQTDPNRNYRDSTISQFLQQYSSKQNFTYSFGYFSQFAFIFDAVSQTFKSSAPNPFGDATYLSNALNKYETITIDPNGTTNYVQAFNAIDTAVVNDAKPSNPWSYILVFMSDGMPKDIADPIDAGIVSLVDNLRNDVQSHGGLITVSSVYFGPESDSQSIDHLQVMANEGQGQFVDTNKLPNGALSINDIINVPGVCR